MDTQVFDRIVKHASDIAGNHQLPEYTRYPGQKNALDTAREVYKCLENSSFWVYVEEIADSLGVSYEYTKQILLALKQGGVKIDEQTDPGTGGRSRIRYRVN